MIRHVRMTPYAKTARRRPDSEHFTRLTRDGRLIGFALRGRGCWHGWLWIAS